MAAEISLVVAYSDNRVIGRDNALPWKLPGDLAHFKQTTMGAPIIMGRKTWQSLGRPLPGRRNIVISRNAAFAAEGAEVMATLQDAVRACAAVPQVFVIGGAQIYVHAIDMATTVLATEVHAQVPGDAFFPLLPSFRWQETERVPQAPENGHAYDFVTYRRRPHA